MYNQDPVVNPSIKFNFFVASPVADLVIYINF
jgi:hypothetical protein